MVEARALHPLADLLRTGTDSAKEDAAKAVRHIALEVALRAAVLEAGALPPLIALMQTGAGAAKGWAAGAVTNLVREAAPRARVV